MAGRNRSKKKIVILIVIGVIAALIIVGVLRMRKAKEELDRAAAQQSISAAVLKKRTIRTKVVGNGALSDGSKEEILMPKGLKISEVFVEEGETVEAGQALAGVEHSSVRDAIADVQSQIDKIDKELLDMEDQKKDEPVKAPVSGRVEAVYAENGSEASSVMEEKGSLMVLRSDSDQREVRITALSGEVKNVRVSEGDAVKQGDELFTLKAVQSETERGQLLTEREELSRIMDTLYDLGKTDRITADSPGIVREIYAKEGEVFSGGTSSLADSKSAELAEGTEQLYSALLSGGIMSTKGAKHALLSRFMLIDSFPDAEVPDDPSSSQDGSGQDTASFEDEGGAVIEEVPAYEDGADPDDAYEYVPDAENDSGFEDTFVYEEGPGFADVYAADAGDGGNDGVEEGVEIGSEEVPAVPDTSQDSAGQNAGGTSGIPDQSSAVNAEVLRQLVQELAARNGTDLSTLLNGTDLSSLLNGTDLSTLLSGTDLTTLLNGTDLASLLGGSNSSLQIDSEQLGTLLRNAIVSQLLGNTDLSSLLGDGAKGLDLSSLLGDGANSLDLSSLLGGANGLDLSTLLGGENGLDLSTLLSGADLSSLLGNSLGSADLASLLGGSLSNADLASLLGSAGINSLAGNADLSSLGAGLTGSASSPALSTYAEAAAFSIAGNDTMDVTVAVNELDILSVVKGQTAEVTLDAIDGETFEGVVTKIAKTGSNTGGVTKYEVTVEVDRDERMRPDMSSTVSILVSEAKDVNVVPTAAVFTEQGKNYVYTEKDEDGTLSGRIEVVTGIADGEYVEIVSGLADGQKVYYRNKTVNYFDMMRDRYDIEGSSESAAS